MLKPPCQYYFFLKFHCHLGHSFEKYFFEVYIFWHLLLLLLLIMSHLLIIESISAPSLIPMSHSNMLFLLFINPTKLHISIFLHAEACKKTCTVVLLLLKIHTFCLHSPTTHRNSSHYPHTHYAQTLAGDEEDLRASVSQEAVVD